MAISTYVPHVLIFVIVTMETDQTLAWMREVSTIMYTANSYKIDWTMAIICEHDFHKEGTTHWKVTPCKKVGGVMKIMPSYLYPGTLEPDGHLTTSHGSNLLL